MTDIFESDSIWYIALPGLGKVFLAERNQQVIGCRKCHADVAPREGYRFHKEKYSSALCNGYLCAGCIEQALKSTPRWQFNLTDGALFRANGYTLIPLDGAGLAIGFAAFGEKGLLVAIERMLKEHAVLIS
jgi:hypothetical protein